MTVTARKNFKQQYSSIDSGVYELVQWLTDEHATEDGPGWSVVEAYDGTNRDVPSGGSKLADLPGTNGWQSGPTITSDGAWIVLESLDGNNSNHFQMYIERGSSTQLNFKLIPLEDFATGGGATSPPTFPSTSVGAGTSLVSFDVTAGLNTWYGVADEGMMAVVVDTGAAGGTDWIYVGELNQARTTGGTWQDDRAYVIMDDPQDFIDHAGAGTVNWNRLSPKDDSTILTSGYYCGLSRADQTPSIFDATTAGIEPDNTSGSEPLGPVGVLFSDSTHYHFAGFLRNVFEGGDWMANRATVGGKNFAVISSFPGIAETRLVIGWDGTRDVP